MRSSRSIAAWTAASSWPSSKGLVRKSTAPAFIARTLVGTSPWPEMKTTGRSTPDAGQVLLDLEAAPLRHSDIETRQSPDGDMAGSCYPASRSLISHILPGAQADAVTPTRGTVFLVDDDPGVLKALTRLLRYPRREVRPLRRASLPQRA